MRVSKRPEKRDFRIKKVAAYLQSLTTQGVQPRPRNDDNEGRRVTKKQAKQIDFTNVSTAYLAEFLGMTRDGVTRLNRGGVIQQNGRARGKYNLVEAISAYATYLRENKDSSATKLAVQRERKLRLQNDETEARLVPIGDAAQVFATFAAEFRRQVEGSLAGLAEELSKTDSPHEVARLMREQFRADVAGPIEWLREVEENERTN